GPNGPLAGVSTAPPAGTSPFNACACNARCMSPCQPDLLIMSPLAPPIPTKPLFAGFTITPDSSSIRPTTTCTRTPPTTTSPNRPGSDTPEPDTPEPEPKPEPEPEPEPSSEVSTTCVRSSGAPPSGTIDD